MSPAPELARRTQPWALVLIAVWLGATLIVGGALPLLSSFDLLALCGLSQRTSVPYP